MELSAGAALHNASENPSKRYPGQRDARFSRGVLLPDLKPKFQFAAPCRVFTIGSCFARNIEEVLFAVDVELPTTKFAAPKSEWKGRPNGLLNEYNPGSMSQRICFALEGEPNTDETIVPGEGGFQDLLLRGGRPVSLHRARERRREIDDVYTHLRGSDLVVITLGLVEAWYDTVSKLWLNRMPPVEVLRKTPERFSFRRLEVTDSHTLLERAVKAMIDAGINKIILTLSPVPLNTTFTSYDAVTANGFSKSVLRVCAESLQEEFPQVDYFPAYEIITSSGTAAYRDDNIHVKDEMVRLVTEMMLDAYMLNRGVLGEEP